MELPDDVDELKNIIVALREELKSAKERCVELEDECDLLAQANEDLRAIASRGILGVSEGNYDTNTEAKTSAPFSQKSQHVESSSAESLPFSHLCIREGDGKFPDSVQARIENACGSKNVIAVDFCEYQGQTMVLCGGVDGYLSGYTGDCDSGYRRELHINMKAPILCIDVHENLIGCAMMDGSHAIVDLSRDLSSEESVDYRKDQTKYVVSIRWRPDGLMYTTVCHDKTVNLYSRVNSPVFTKLASLNFLLSPEDAVFILQESSSPSESLSLSMTPNSQWHLVIALRDTNYLLYINCDDLSQKTIPLNENDWDQHVSFTALHLNVSPDHKHLLVATDKHLALLLRPGTNQRTRMLSGHQCGEYGKPKVAWDQSGDYVYINSEGEPGIYVYSVASGKVVKVLSGHLAVVKDMASHKTQRLMASASFDRSVIVWNYRE